MGVKLGFVADAEVDLGIRNLSRVAMAGAERLKRQRLPPLRQVAPQIGDARCSRERLVFQQRQAAGLDALGGAENGGTAARHAFYGFPHSIVEDVRRMADLREFFRPAGARAIEDHFDSVAGLEARVSDGEPVEDAPERFLAGFGIRQDDDGCFHVGGVG